MDSDSHVAMDDEEIEAFLGNGGVGVLSLSNETDDPPYTVPVSYGYDPEGDVFYFRLAVGPDSSKPELNDRAASFVVHREEDERWRSVVADGRLEDAHEESIATDTLDGMDRVEIPLIDIFDNPTRVVSFEFYRLVPRHLTGRVESRPGNL
ncbi:pyridoxamine 5'-phosphate oxidase family protein [Haloarcula marina]|uniref:pyridoxamine 5'-phosphate oxidase family protein n=1 Tax=Haloarcula marina TaxID=2961574 RepID=UPI0020B68053|nr:pyridoxamine 5'-phosphate oxidase family protein [Halomicroarcula marina]